MHAKHPDERALELQRTQVLFTKVYPGPQERQAGVDNATDEAQLGSPEPATGARHFDRSSERTYGLWHSVHCVAEE